MKVRSMIVSLILLSFLLSSCGAGREKAYTSLENEASPEITAAQPTAPPPEHSTEPTPEPTPSPTPEPTPIPLPERVITPLEELGDDTFVRVLDYIPNIYVDLKYATEENFTGKRIYPFEYSEAYLRCGTVKKLIVAEEKAEEAGYRLKIWDAFRPVSAQFRLWEIVPNPVYVANPNNGYSSHSRGNTVDITLVYENGYRVQMPTGFDDFTTKADRDYSDCTAEEKENALFLQNLMVECGFTPYKGEWWHFADTVSYQVGQSFEPPELVLESWSEETAVSVQYQFYFTGKKNTVHISFAGISEQREPVWRYDTELNIGGQASSAKEIGTNNGLYYYQTESAIRAFRISDGKILWTNLDFGGPCLTSSVFDDAGTLYVGGWERTDLIVIDANGKTLAYIDLPDYASPRIELEETRAKLSFDYGPNESENVVYVDLRDYSVVLPEIEPSDNPAEPVSDIPVGVTGRQIEA